MNIPKEIPIFGIWVAIKEVKELKDENGDLVDGICHYGKKLIEIEKSLKGDDKRIALLHEVYHFALNRCSTNQTNISDEAQEITVDICAKITVEISKITFKIEFE